MFPKELYHLRCRACRVRPFDLLLGVTAEMKMRWSIDGMIGQGTTKVLGEKCAPVLLCPQQIQHRLSRVRYRIFAVSDWRLTGCAVLKMNKTYERNIAARSVAFVAVRKQWEYILHIIIACCL